MSLPGERVNSARMRAKLTPEPIACGLRPVGSLLLAATFSNVASPRIEVPRTLLALLAGSRRWSCGRLDEAAAVEQLAAHRHLERAVRRAIGAQRGLVAIRERERREARERNFAVGVELDHAFDERPRP